MIDFRDRKGSVLRIIIAYRSHANSGPYTVYQQRIQYFTSKNSTKCLIVNFDEKLVTLIGNWVENGDQVMLVMGVNNDLAKEKTGNFRNTMSDI